MLEMRALPAGHALLNTPLLNKGTAFSAGERDAFRLHGLLPPHIGSLDEQVARRLAMLRRFGTGFEKYAFLRDLQDTNETLFYALLTRNIEEMLPLVYTPTVGEGCQRFSEIWRKPRGLFLALPNRGRIAEILADPVYDAVRVIVVTDGERILGLGDQGAGGLGISIGKLALYTALGGIPPEHCLPVVLDVGTDNQERLDNPLYVGWRSARVRGPDYDGFVEDFVTAVQARWPGIVLQWEDFAGANASAILRRYRARLCTFNDDIQSTAAVAAATVLAALTVTGERLADQRIVMLGLGSAGLGIAELLVRILVEDGLSEEQARERFYALGSKGLLREGNAGHGEQSRYVRKAEDWMRDGSLLETVAHVHPTILIGTSGQAGAFDEAVVREMARHVDRPIILPLSNPTSKSEAAPQNLLDWTAGTAITGTGSPYPPVKFGDAEIPIDQTNNSYIFPGMGLGLIVSGAAFVSDEMFIVAAKTLAGLSPTVENRKGRLLPPLTALRDVAFAIGVAVAKQAVAEGAVLDGEASIEERLHSYMWTPEYRALLPGATP